MWHWFIRRYLRWSSQTFRLHADYIAGRKTRVITFIYLRILCASSTMRFVYRLNVGHYTQHKHQIDHRPTGNILSALPSTRWMIEQNYHDKWKAMHSAEFTADLVTWTTRANASRSEEWKIEASKSTGDCDISHILLFLQPCVCACFMKVGEYISLIIFKIGGVRLSHTQHAVLNAFWCQTNVYDVQISTTQNSKMHQRHDKHEMKHTTLAISHICDFLGIDSSNTIRSKSTSMKWQHRMTFASMCDACVCMHMKRGVNARHHHHTHTLLKRVKSHAQHNIVFRFDCRRTLSIQVRTASRAFTFINMKRNNETDTNQTDTYTYSNRLFFIFFLRVLRLSMRIIFSTQKWDFYSLSSFYAE